MQLITVSGAHGALRLSDREEHLSTAYTSSLSAQFDTFVEPGVLTRIQYNEISPRSEYELTDTDDQLRARLEPLFEWAITHS